MASTRTNTQPPQPPALAQQNAWFDGGGSWAGFDVQGADVARTPEVPEPPASPYAQNADPSFSTRTAYAQPYVATKDHVAAALLAIFLGSLGIHKFYLGYTTAGFIMLAVTILGSLVSLGIAGAVMAVIGIIEGIIYLTKSQSAFDALYVYNTQEWF